MTEAFTGSGLSPQRFSSEETTVTNPASEKTINIIILILLHII
jgi:hypothetical protein